MQPATTPAVTTAAPASPLPDGWEVRIDMQDQNKPPRLAKNCLDVVDLDDPSVPPEVAAWARSVHAEHWRANAAAIARQQKIDHVVSTLATMAVHLRRMQDELSALAPAGQPEKGIFAGIPHEICTLWNEPDASLSTLASEIDAIVEDIVTNPAHADLLCREPSEGDAAATPAPTPAAA